MADQCCPSWSAGPCTTALCSTKNSSAHRSQCLRTQWHLSANSATLPVEKKIHAQKLLDSVLPEHWASSRANCVKSHRVIAACRMPKLQRFFGKPVYSLKWKFGICLRNPQTKIEHIPPNRFPSRSGLSIQHVRSKSRNSPLDAKSKAVINSQLLGSKVPKLAPCFLNAPGLNGMFFTLISSKLRVQI